MKSGEQLTSQQKGKWGEYIVIGKLLRKGLEVYIPAYDVGVDCIVRAKNDMPMTIQIKTCSKYAQNRYADVYLVDPVDIFYVIVYDERNDDLYIVSGKEIARRLNPRKTDKAYRIDLDVPKQQKWLELCKNNFEVLYKE